MVTFLHEYNDKGGHRLVAMQGKETFAGAWVTFIVPAMINIKGEIYFAFTPYYSGSVPVDVAVSLTEMPTVTGSPAKPGEQCGVRLNNLVCDLPIGHTGSHRAF
jgi:hypothetical protein